MKRFIAFLFGIFLVPMARAETMNLNWIVDGETYAQTTCDVGNDINTPQPEPEKYGYTVQYNEYIPLEYISGTTSTYIDTNQKTTNLSKIETKFKIPSGTLEFFLYRTESGSSSSTSAYLHTAGYWRFRGQGIMMSGTTYSTDINISIQDKTGIVLNGTRKGSYSNIGTFVSTVNLRFLCSPSKYYYFKHYKNDELIFDGVPVRRKSDSALGILDLVSGKFFVNQGSGTFTAGPEL